MLPLPRLMNTLIDWQVRYNFLYSNPSIYIWQKRHVLSALDLNFAYCKFDTFEGRDFQSQ